MGLASFMGLQINQQLSPLSRKMQERVSLFFKLVLLKMRAFLEGQRALALACAHLSDCESLV